MSAFWCDMYAVHSHLDVRGFGKFHLNGRASVALPWPEGALLAMANSQGRKATGKIRCPLGSMVKKPLRGLSSARNPIVRLKYMSERCRLPTFQATVG